jgi:hypothetical protein
VPGYNGPFKIMEKIRVIAYRLKFLEQLKLHPTFHVIYLRPFHEDQEDLK